MRGSYKDVGRFCGTMAAGYGKSMSQGGSSFYITIAVVLLICFFLYFITADSKSIDPSEYSHKKSLYTQPKEVQLTNRNTAALNVLLTATQLLLFPAL